MLYLTTRSISLISFHLSRTYEKYHFYKVNTEEELIEKLVLGSVFTKQISLIDATDLIDPERVFINKYQTSYICLKTISPTWENLIEDHEGKIEILKLDPLVYRGELDKVKGIFEPEAYHYFWDKFKNTPGKLNAELIRLILKVGSEKVRIRKDYLEDLYDLEDSNLFFEIIATFGTLKCNKLIMKASLKDLYTLFIGNKKKLARVQIEATKKQNVQVLKALNLIQEAFLSKAIDLRLGLIVLNNSLVQKIELAYLIDN